MGWMHPPGSSETQKRNIVRYFWYFNTSVFILLPCIFSDRFLICLKYSFWLYLRQLAFYILLILSLYHINLLLQFEFIATYWYWLGYLARREWIFHLSLRYLRILSSPRVHTNITFRLTKVKLIWMSWCASIHRA